LSHTGFYTPVVGLATLGRRSTEFDPFGDEMVKLAIGLLMVIAVVVGCGSSAVTVPDVVGQSRSDAAKEIRAAGLDVRVVAEPVELRPLGEGCSILNPCDYSAPRVQAQNPDAGAAIEPDSIVTVTLGKK
jgi:beta-lactam-binding protein with PASTA domain